MNVTLDMNKVMGAAESSQLRGAAAFGAEAQPRPGQQGAGKAFDESLQAARRAAEAPPAARQSDRAGAADAHHRALAKRRDGQRDRDARADRDRQGTDAADDARQASRASRARKSSVEGQADRADTGTTTDGTDQAAESQADALHTGNAVEQVAADASSAATTGVALSRSTQAYQPTSGTTPLNQGAIGSSVAIDAAGQGGLGSTGDEQAGGDPQVTADPAAAKSAASARTDAASTSATQAQATAAAGASPAARHMVNDDTNPPSASIKVDAADESAKLIAALKAIDLGSKASTDNSAAVKTADPFTAADAEPGADPNGNIARAARGLQAAFKQGGGTVSLRLEPPELGTLRIDMQMVNGAVRATFGTEHEGVRALLSQQMGQLRHALESQGVSVDRLEVQVQSPPATPQDDGQRQAQTDDGRSRGQFADSRQFGQGRQGDRQDESAPQRTATFHQMLNAVA
ncbi:MAG: flagellar hook-length control protein FliK [Phycisphaeraceae bacterium]